MTKKDFELIASELYFQNTLLGYNDGKITGSDSTVYDTSCNLWANALSKINKNFNKIKFLEACKAKKMF